MKFLVSIPLALLLISPSCQNHFQTGVIEITDSHGTRRLHSDFHGGEFGKIGRGVIFRAQLSDGSTLMIETSEALQPEEKK